ncbi:MAG TPA: hypothetical protein VM695_09970 [Phycisphaerae bacterium]|nr:hypothetical protein [Phycisphaerae bacterium]
MLEIVILVVFLVGIGALAVAYFDQRELLRESLAEHKALVEHLKVAATTGRRDIAAAFTDLINAVQFHMPAGGGPVESKLHPAPSDVDLWYAEQETLRKQRKGKSRETKLQEEPAGEEVA